MQRVKTIIALLLLGLWLPCTMHCQAEALGWLGDDSTCCGQSHEDDSSAPDCGDCGVCSAVESGGYSLPQNAAFIHLPLVAAVRLAPSLIDLVRKPSVLTLSAPDSTPQFLCQSWTFDRRTALSPRAPSLLA